MQSLVAILSLAATAGLLAFFSPCGYALLPAYIGFFLSRHGDNPSKKALAKDGILFGLFVILGFVSVLGVLWVIAATVGNIIGSFLPQLSLIIGIILVLAGLYMFIKPSKFSVRLPGFLSKSRGGYLGAYFFGLAYIIGGIGCTLPIFIAVLAQAALLGPAQSLLTFAAFTGVMSLLMIVVTGLLIVARQALFNKLKKFLPYVQRIGAALLIVAGVYLLIVEL